MAILTSEKNVKLRWLPTRPASADLSELTTAELATAIDINARIVTSGIGIELTQNEATAPMVETGKIAKAPGTQDASITLTSLRDSEVEADVIWETFELGLEGCLLVSRFGVPTEDSRVELYECVSFDPVPIAPAQDDFQQSQVRLSPGDWNLKAVVVSGSGGGGG